MTSKTFRSGFVIFIGRPNVGKSTLLNALIGNKISIISSIPQTTRHQIKGILNLEQAQIVFVDTPGIHSFHDRLSRQLNTIARQSIEGCDLILYIVDVSRVIGREELDVMDFLTRQDINIIMALNKIDLGPKFLHEYVKVWRQKIEEKGKKDPLIYYLPVSARSGKNVDTLKDVIVENLPEQPAFYELGTLTDFPTKFRVADIVREKLFQNLKKELPHSLAVEVEQIEDKNKVYFIRVNIYVNRVSQKKIIIGTGGSLLKQIGTEARPELEQIVGKKVYLELWVKVLRNWQDKPRILQELGYEVA